MKVSAKQLERMILEIYDEERKRLPHEDKSQDSINYDWFDDQVSKLHDASDALDGLARSINYGDGAFRVEKIAKEATVDAKIAVDRAIHRISAMLINHYKVSKLKTENSSHRTAEELKEMILEIYDEEKERLRLLSERFDAERPTETDHKWIRSNFVQLETSADLLGTLVRKIHPNDNSTTTEKAARFAAVEAHRALNKVIRLLRALTDSHRR